MNNTCTFQNTACQVIYLFGVIVSQHLFCLEQKFALVRKGISHSRHKKYIYIYT